MVAITDCDLRSAANRPRRIFDSGPLRRGWAGARYVAWMVARDDVDLDRRMNRLGTQRFRRQICYLLGFFSTLRNLRALRAAKTIFCLTPHHFWWMVLLWRVGLLPVRGRTIGGVFFRSRPFLRKLGLIRRLPAEFCTFFIAPRQIGDLRRAGCPPERLRHFTWRIDTGWYRPAPVPPTGSGDRVPYLLCPGQAYRDDALIRQLIGRTPIKIIRATRTSALAESYRGLTPDPRHFEFRLVLDHHQYLELLQHAAAILLPIATDDEPAGLTTALEALACEVPLLANASYEVSELLAAAYNRAPLPDNAADTWLAAIGETLAGRAVTAADLRRGRELAEARYSLGAAGEAPDWAEVLGPDRR